MGVKLNNHRWITEKNVFKQINDKYKKTIFQYKTKWLGRLSLDIYIPNKKIAIEVQGEQHFKPLDYFGGYSQFKRQFKNDKLKKKLCKKYNIKLFYYSNNVKHKRLHGIKVHHTIESLMGAIKLHIRLKLYFNIIKFNIILFLILYILFIYTK